MNASTYKAISPAFAGLSVCYDDCLLDVPELLEELPKGLVGRVVRQPPDKDLGERCILLGNGHVVVCCLYTHKQRDFLLSCPSLYVHKCSSKVLESPKYILVYIMACGLIWK